MNRKPLLNAAPAPLTAAWDLSAADLASLQVQQWVEADTSHGLRGLPSTTGTWLDSLLEQRQPHTA